MKPEYVYRNEGQVVGAMMNAINYKLWVWNSLPIN
jgi:hypothetical protein